MPTASDPVPAITEADATGEIAAIYRDIRAILGVPVVNLIWRYLATMPGALPWTWDAVRPLYVSGAVANAAANLRQSLVLPPQPAWPVAVLEAAGLDAGARSGIGQVLSSYDRSNAMNLVALAALRAKADGDTDAAPLQAVDPGVEIAGELPFLVAIDQMPPATADTVRALNAMGDPDQRVLASMYRHLSHWPPFLALVWSRLAPLDADGTIDRMIAQNLEIAHGISRQLAHQMPKPTTALSPPVKADAEAALDLFIHYAIGRMVPIGRMLSIAFPRP
jgi:hypothetical protein